MKTIDLVGYLAAALVLATFCTRSMNKLRLIALASNFAFITYGYLANLAPVLILHSALLPVNAYRLVQLCWTEPATKLVAIFSRVHSITAHVTVVFVLAFALAGGGYELFAYLSKTSNVIAREPVTGAAIPTKASVDATGHLKALGRLKSYAAALGGPVGVAAHVNTAVDTGPGRPKATGAPPRLRPIIAGERGDEVKGADAVAPGQTRAANSDVAEASPFGGPIPASRSKDAKLYRERGVALCRRGDFSLAITDFDQAIRLDPNSEVAYVDRGIALYGLGESGRAFADIVQAKRMKNSRQAATLLSKPRKARSSLE